MDTTTRWLSMLGIGTLCLYSYREVWWWWKLPTRSCGFPY